MMRTPVALLRGLNLGTCAVLVLIAAAQYITRGLWGPLILTAGILIAGPIEDILMHYLAEQPPQKGDCVSQLIDQLTSWLLCLALLAASLLY